MPHHVVLWTCPPTCCKYSEHVHLPAASTLNMTMHLPAASTPNMTTYLLQVLRTWPPTCYKYSEHDHLPATSTPQKKESRRKPTINTSPVMDPTAIPAMAPADKPSRAVVSGDRLVAVGRETWIQSILPLSRGLRSHSSPKRMALSKLSIAFLTLCTVYEWKIHTLTVNWVGLRTRLK